MAACELSWSETLFDEGIEGLQLAGDRGARDSSSESVRGLNVHGMGLK